MKKQSLFIRGMHGLGDAIHQRAILRELMPAHDVWIESSWPCVYHDLIPQGLHVVRIGTHLRAPLKNATREAAKFQGDSRPAAPILRIAYGADDVRSVPSKTILEAMFKAAGIQSAYPRADFRLPVPSAWCDSRVDAVLQAAADRPLLIYRPLIVRPEWRGSQVRNANPDDYADVFAALRDDYFVVSLADLERDREWIAGPRLKADLEFHQGQLTFEQIAALTSRAKLVYTSSGMGSVLGPAVSAPTVSIAGGYEPSGWHSDSGKFSPFLGIDPVEVCWCGSSDCQRDCSKKLDMPTARARVLEFARQNGVVCEQRRPLTEMFEPPEPTRFLPPAPVRGRQLRAPRLIGNRPRPQPTVAIHPRPLRPLRGVRA